MLEVFATLVLPVVFGESSISTTFFAMGPVLVQFLQFVLPNPTGSIPFGKLPKYSQSRKSLNCVVVTPGIGIFLSPDSLNWPSNVALKYGDVFVKRSLLTMNGAFSAPM